MKPLEWIMKHAPQRIVDSMLPPRWNEWSLLTPDGTGKQTRINLDKLHTKLNKAANAAEEALEVKKITDQAIKDNPLNNGLPF